MLPIRWWGPSSENLLVLVGARASGEEEAIQKVYEDAE
jgi:hypothetical protein